MMAYELIEARKNGFLLKYNQYLYRQDKKVDVITYYKCRSKTRCPAKVTVTNGVLEYNGLMHNHEDHSAEIMQLEIKTALKKEVLSQPTSSLRNAYHKVLTEKREEFKDAHEEDEVSSILPAYISVKTIMSRERRKEMPKLPRKKDQIILDGEWILYKGNRFLLASENQNEIILFGTIPNLQKLSASETVLMDGTFYTAPALYRQLYSFHGSYRGHIFPLCFALLPEKSKTTYIKIFRIMQDVAAENELVLNPKTFQIDFEMATLQAIQVVFPEAQIRGCMFHFTKCIWRKVQEVGLQVQYNDNQEIKKMVKRIAGLPLLKIDDITDAWLEIHGDADETICGVTELLDYVVRNWVEEDRPIFARALWNHPGNIGPRTTNNLEGWHNSFRILVGKAHPNVYEFINALKKQQDRNENNFAILSGGGNISRFNKKYKDMNSRIANLNHNYVIGNITPLEILDSVKYLLHID